MTISITIKAFAVWIGILLLAIANGVFREVFLIPTLGEISGLILSGVLLSIFILFVVYFALPWIGKTVAVNYVLIGISWLCMTLFFEFTFGYAQGKSWQQLFDAYLFKDGNIWPIVILITALAPYLSAKVRGWT